MKICRGNTAEVFDYDVTKIGNLLSPFTFLDVKSFL